MGRIKTKQVKRIANKLVRSDREKFTKNFEKNKKILAELADIESKKLRNVISGYITRLLKQQKS